MILIDGKKEAALLREELKKEVSDLKAKYNKVPGLTVILIGDISKDPKLGRNLLILFRNGSVNLYVSSNIE